jgi:Ser/Thr protein kinase RdoA (MazF antagonist)
MLGELHALPSASGALGRPGGAWHHLAEGSPGDELTAVPDLLDDRARTAGADDRAACDTLRREISGLDAGAGLPEALIHPDFVMANVVAAPDTGMVLVDWAGAGRGPRAWSLAFLLYAEAAKNVLRIDLVQQHIRLEPEELKRLEPTIRARPIVLAAWSFCLGRRETTQMVQAVTAARSLAQAAAARALEVFR